MVGSRFGDVLTGSAGANTIWVVAGMTRCRAGVATDQLAGQSGNDTLEGHGGNDALNGGANFDRGNGGAGSDTQVLCEVVVQIP